MPEFISQDLPLDVLITVLFFLISFLTVSYYRNFRINSKEQDRKNKLESMLMGDYIHKFDEYNNIISDLQTKIGILELKIAETKNDFNHNKIYQDSERTENKVGSTSQSALEVVSRGVTVTNSKEKNVTEDGRHATTIFQILKLLEGGARTSREIQKSINKSREHTSRLMKKMYLQNMVSRIEGTKPFRYNITTKGHKQMELNTNQI